MRGSFTARQPAWYVGLERFRPYRIRSRYFVPVAAGPLSMIHAPSPAAAADALLLF